MSEPSPTSPGTCPRCLVTVHGEDCASCGLSFVRPGGLIDVLGAANRERRASEVEEFYTRNPFPGYAPADDAGSLMERCRRMPFMVQLDAAIPPDAEIVDCGCGTAQVPAYLALTGPRRRVFGVDGCRESLRHAEQFRDRIDLKNLQLVRADLFELPLPKRRFPVVISRGAVHHTPDPDRAIAGVAELVAPGGWLVLGFYESWARCFHRTRRALGRATGREWWCLDPVLRRRDLDPEKKRVWLEDQYRHPLERLLPLPRVVQRLRELGLHWVRTIPPVSRGGGLFEPTPEPTPFSLASLRAGWALRGVNDPDAGLVVLVARRGS